MNIGIYNPRVGIARAGGTETFLREMMQRLATEHDVTLYCGAGELLDEVTQLPVTVRQIPFVNKESRLNAALTGRTPVLPAEVESLSMYLNARRKGVFKQMAAEVEVLSTHYYLDNLLVSRVAPAATLFRFPGIKKPSPRWKAMRTLASPTMYLANSETTADRLRDWLDLEVDGTVYAGVDLDKFGPDVDPAFDDETVSILFVGRLDEGKGISDLLEAKARLDGAVCLYIVGNGTLEDSLREEVRKLGIQESVEFVGAVPHDEVPRYYSAADIFCLPSYHEGFPIVNMEALASGCSVVSTKIGSIEEQLRDGEDALLVEPGDVDALTDALGRLVNDIALRERLSSTGLERAVEFSWDKQAAKMEEFYAQTR